MSAQAATSVAAARRLVAIVASAGGIEALQRILGGLPRDLPAAIVIVQHRRPDARSLLVSILRRATALAVEPATEGELLRAGTVLVAPAERHVEVTADRRIQLIDGRRIRHVRSSANPLFTSGARVFGADMLAVVLTGYDSDGTDGVQDVARQGGAVIAQEPSTAVAAAMPRAAIGTGAVDDVLDVEHIAPAIVHFAEAGAHPR